MDKKEEETLRKEKPKKKESGVNPFIISVIFTGLLLAFYIPALHWMMAIWVLGGVGYGWFRIFKGRESNSKVIIGLGGGLLFFLIIAQLRIFRTIFG